MKYTESKITFSSTKESSYLEYEDKNIMFSDYARHFANIQATLAGLLDKAKNKLGSINLIPSITGSGGLTLAKHLGMGFVQEVIAVASSLQFYAPNTDVAIYNENGRNMRTVWSIATKGIKEGHYASFPEELVIRCLLAGCPIDGIVLDPFLGSGTTLKVAKSLNLNGVGVELKKEYKPLSLLFLHDILGLKIRVNMIVY